MQGVGDCWRELGGWTKGLKEPGGKVETRLDEAGWVGRGIEATGGEGEDLWMALGLSNMHWTAVEEGQGPRT